MTLPEVRQGMKLKPLPDGLIPSPKKVNVLMALGNGLLNSKIVFGTGNKVIITENGIVFQVDDSGGSGSGTGNMNYRGEYANDAVPNYLAGDVVRVSPTNVFSSTQVAGTTVPGVYICIQDNPNPDSDFPVHPLQEGGETLFWNWLATWPSEIIVCNSVSNREETWLIDGQLKPIWTADSKTVTADSDSATADGG